MNHEGSSFVVGCAPFTNMVFFTKEIDADVSAGKINTTFLLWDDEIEDEDSRWMQYDLKAPWRPVGIATVKPSGGDRVTVALSSKGDYFEVEPLSLTETLEKISPAVSGIRTVKSWDETIYAAGMGRKALKRKALGEWTEFGPSDKDVGEDTVVGFEDIHGFSQQDIYAVGWLGEIWWHENDKWKQVKSPVTSKLNALTCAGDGVVYAVGDNGTMVKGRKNKWAAVETGVSENLLDVAFFDDEIYAVTNFKILKLVDGKLTPVTNFEEEVQTDCLHLLESEDGLVSIGHKSLFTLRDGEWRKVV